MGPLLLTATAALTVVTSLASSDVTSSASGSGLYRHDRHVINLDNSTFYDVLLHKDHAWALEFYKDWCGHCRRFAPKWSKFAQSISDWGTVLKVAAINCADPRNRGVCRRYRIHGVPNVKLFGPNASRLSPGVPIDKRSPDALIGAVIEFISATQHHQRPPTWPDLTPFTGTLDEILQSPEPVQALVLEGAGSATVGRSVQLDFSAHQQVVRVRRAVRLPAGLQEQTPERPAMVVFRAGRQQTVLAKPGQNVRQLFSSSLRRLIGGNPPAQTATRASVAPSTEAPPPASTHAVFMVDMENAIGTALREEVAGRPVIDAQHMVALRRFVRALVAHFPGRQRVRRSLHQLLQAISDRDSMTGEQMERQLRTMAPGLPQIQPWRACRGSASAYRGYSCGLWTLFHTMTVQAMANERPERPFSILPAIHGFVKHFFGCRHCSEHFQQMAAEDGLFNVTSSREAVLWLWRAHNKVNKRLTGDLTEDPRHPKVQFPSTRQCPVCSQNGQHHIPSVLLFLSTFYSQQQLQMDGLQPLSSPTAGESTGAVGWRQSAAAGESIGQQSRNSAPRPNTAPLAHMPLPEERVLEIDHRTVDMANVPVIPRPYRPRPYMPRPYRPSPAETAGSSPAMTVVQVRPRPYMSRPAETAGSSPAMTVVPVRPRPYMPRPAETAGSSPAMTVVAARPHPAETRGSAETQPSPTQTQRAHSPVHTTLSHTPRAGSRVQAVPGHRRDVTGRRSGPTVVYGSPVLVRMSPSTLRQFSAGSTWASSAAGGETLPPVVSASPGASVQQPRHSVRVISPIPLRTSQGIMHSFPVQEHGSLGLGGRWPVGGGQGPSDVVQVYWFPTNG